MSAGPSRVDGLADQKGDRTQIGSRRSLPFSRGFPVFVQRDGLMVAFFLNCKTCLFIIIAHLCSVCNPQTSFRKAMQTANQRNQISTAPDEPRDAARPLSAVIIPPNPAKASAVLRKNPMTSFNQDKDPGIGIRQPSVVEAANDTHASLDTLAAPAVCLLR